MGPVNIRCEQLKAYVDHMSRFGMPLTRIFIFVVKNSTSIIEGCEKLCISTGCSRPEDRIHMIEEIIYPIVKEETSRRALRRMHRYLNLKTNSKLFTKKGEVFEIGKECY